MKNTTNKNTKILSIGPVMKESVPSTQCVKFEVIIAKLLVHD